MYFLFLNILQYRQRPMTWLRSINLSVRSMVWIYILIHTLHLIFTIKLEYCWITFKTSSFLRFGNVSPQSLKIIALVAVILRGVRHYSAILGGTQPTCFKAHHLFCIFYELYIEVSHSIGTFIILDLAPTAPILGLGWNSITLSKIT